MTDAGRPGAAAPSWRQLAPVAVAVLAVHVWALQAGSLQVLRPAPEASPRPLTTRTISMAPVAPVVVGRGEAQRTPDARTTPVTASKAASPGPTTPSPSPRASRAIEPSPPLTPAPASAIPEPPRPDAAASPPAVDTRVSPVALPAPARYRYEVTVQKGLLSAQGEAVLHWRHDGAEYEARLELRGTLLPDRTQRSTGRVTPDGLAPRYFADRYRGEQATHFDPDQGRVIFSNNKPMAAWAPGMQDRLSVVLQLAALVAGEPGRFLAGGRVEIPTAGTRDAEPWTFHVEGEEDLQLPGGAVRALKLQRLPRRDYDQKVELWLAPRLDYAPVRLRLTNPNGDTVDQRWSATDRG